MRKDNKGVSLIELIVIVAIMGVLLGVVGLSMRAVSDRKVSKAGNSTKSMIKIAQTYARSNDGIGFLVIEGTDNGVEVSVKKVESLTDVSDSTKWQTGYGPDTLNERINATIFFVKKNGTDKENFPINNGDRAIFVFDKKLGNFAEKCMFIKADGTIACQNKCVEKLTFDNGDKALSLIFSYNTGAVYMEAE